MPAETQRTVMLKRLYDPDDKTNYIDVPVITEILFNDASDGQDYDRTFDNTQQNGTRTVHIHEVKSLNQSGGNGGTSAGSGGSPFNVERIDSIQVKNADWDEQVDLNNNDPAPLPPEGGAGGHLQSHVVRYNKDNTNDPNSMPWIDVELVDAIEVSGYFLQRDINNLSDSDAAQDTTLTLQNDPGDTSFNDPNDPYAPAWSDINYWSPQASLPEDTNGNPDPVRLDPFQNIVNAQWGGGLAVIFYDGAGGPPLPPGQGGPAS